MHNALLEMRLRSASQSIAHAILPDNNGHVNVSQQTAPRGYRRRGIRRSRLSIVFQFFCPPYLLLRPPCLFSVFPA